MSRSTRYMSCPIKLDDHENKSDCHDDKGQLLLIRFCQSQRSMPKNQLTMTRLVSPLTSPPPPTSSTPPSRYRVWDKEEDGRRDHQIWTVGGSPVPTPCHRQGCQNGGKEVVTIQKKHPITKITTFFKKKSIKHAWWCVIYRLTIIKSNLLIMDQDLDPCIALHIYIYKFIPYSSCFLLMDSLNYFTQKYSPKTTTVCVKVCVYMYRILEMEWRGVRREKEGKRRGLKAQRPSESELSWPSDQVRQVDLDLLRSCACAKLYENNGTQLFFFIDSERQNVWIYLSSRHPL